MAQQPHTFYHIHHVTFNLVVSARKSVPWKNKVVTRKQGHTEHVRSYDLYSPHFSLLNQLLQYLSRAVKCAIFRDQIGQLSYCGFCH